MVNSLTRHIPSFHQLRRLQLWSAMPWYTWANHPYALRSFSTSVERFRHLANILLTSDRFGSHLVDILWSSGEHLVDIWWTSCWHLVNILWSSGEHLVDIFLTSGEHLVNILWTSGKNLIWLFDILDLIDELKMHLKQDTYLRLVIDCLLFVPKLKLMEGKRFPVN